MKKLFLTAMLLGIITAASAQQSSDSAFFRNPEETFFLEDYHGTDAVKVFLTFEKQYISDSTFLRSVAIGKSMDRTQASDIARMNGRDKLRRLAQKTEVNIVSGTEIKEMDFTLPDGDTVYIVVFEAEKRNVK